MQNELKEKLQNLSEKFNTDLDVISLKALCSVPENEEILFAITGTLNRLIEKYPDDEEILGLLPKKEKISLESLIEVLQETYPSNVEVFTIKALSTFPEEELREKAIAQSLERILEVNPNDENIMGYLEIEDVIPKEKNPDMVFVEGGSYIPSFYKEEVNVLDLYVNKYITTQKDWEELEEKLEFDKQLEHFVGERKPAVGITWIEILEYCNKMSEKYGLQPVYNIEYSEDTLKKIALVTINQLDGKKVPTNLADFSKTEGYRLPTETEWEWFAFGGKITLEDRKFPRKEKGVRDTYGWFSSYAPHDVGTKKPNELGIYDIIGNVWQLLYDTYHNQVFYMDKNKAYIWDKGDSKYTDISTRGGNYDFDYDYNPFYFRHSSSLYKGSCTVGFRVVRTANPKRR